MPVGTQLMLRTFLATTFGLLVCNSLLQAQEIGTLTINGDFTNEANGTLLIQIAGTDGEGEDPNGHDSIVVQGNAILDGTLSVETSFTPAVGSPAGVIGDSFSILEAASVSGSFATIEGRHMGAGRFYMPMYNPTNLTLGAFQALAGDATGDKKN